MKKMLVILISLFFLSPICFAASLNSMNKQEIVQALQDKTITTVSLVTINKQLMNDSFIGYFSKDGKVQGRFVTKPENDPQTDTGVWTAKANGTLCVTWQNWNKGNPICVYSYKLNNALVLINLDNNLETLILNDNIKSGNQVS